MNELWIYDVIGESFFEAGVTAQWVRDELKKFDDEEPLLVRINSPGGMVHHAVSIRQQLAERKGEVNVQIDGLAASAASFIATVGKYITIAEGSLYMIHNPWSVAIGDAKAMRKEASVLDKLGTSLQKVYENRSGKDSGEIAKLLDEETWYDATEAVEAGFADEVLSDQPAQAIVIPAAMGFRHPPATAPVIETRVRPCNQIAALQRRIDLARASA